MNSRKFGILSAVFAPLCCLGPLVAVSLGLGGVGLASFFGKTHWLWIGLGAVLLFLGWFKYWRELRPACKTGCDLSAGKRTRAILLAATLIVAAFAAMHVWTGHVRRPAAQAAHVAGGVTAVISVEGLVCFSCELAVENGLKSAPGVLGVAADSKNGRVTVQFDPAVTNAAAIKQKIAASGYKVAESIKEVMK